MRGLGVFATVVLLASSAQAYCLTHTRDPASAACPSACSDIGLPLAWSNPDVSYALNQRGFPGLTDAQLRTTFATAFATWSQLSCGGQPVGFTFAAEDEPSPLEEGPLDDEPNTNVIVHYDRDTWLARDHSPNAFAVTSVWFATNGTISGADIMFNGAMGPFGDCASQTCGTGLAVRTDLQNVATHEIGHFLGLAHSAVEDSTMACEARAGETLKRTLEVDDVAGLCEAYPPGVAFRELPPQEGCTLGHGSEGGLCMLGLLLLLRQRVTPSTRKPSARSHSATLVG